MNGKNMQDNLDQLIESYKQKSKALELSIDALRNIAKVNVNTLIDYKKAFGQCQGISIKALQDIIDNYLDPK